MLNGLRGSLHFCVFLLSLTSLSFSCSSIVKVFALSLAATLIAALAAGPAFEREIFDTRSLLL